MKLLVTNIWGLYSLVPTLYTRNPKLPVSEGWNQLRMSHVYGDPAILAGIRAEVDALLLKKAPAVPFGFIAFTYSGSVGNQAIHLLGIMCGLYFFNPYKPPDCEP